jgi:hypothetical protein
MDNVPAAFAFRVKEIDEPSLENERTDTDEDRWVKFRTESADPRRVVERREIDEPNPKKSKTERAVEIFDVFAALPPTDNPLPNRE